ncbi:unnamed protein product [Bemisia tabaci]|uniref:DNA repair protein complementing XP-G cells n=1 Tax=Bemisia tabaci TaxID=7038 RepID=A0A9P0EVP7_BEMTA|nr:unnamed protein product [Bemisia tabaci]
MGVHGLWKLIEPAGKPVPVETLENKTLAVDVSIWLHQLVKGYQDSGGGTVANAHLLGLFHRICKLLYFKVKPIFVFDGGVPVLKKQTIAARRSQRSKADEIAAKLREQILKNLIQQRAVGHASGSREVAPSIPSHLLNQKEDDMFELPPVPSTSKEEEPEEEEEEFKPMFSTNQLQKIDVNSKEFKALPADMRHDILSEMKELRKQNSWRHINEMPDSGDDFSGFQLGRLMKRRNIQVSLEEAAKEMGGRTLSLNEMQKMFEEDGIITDAEVTQRIASDSSTRFVYIPVGLQALRGKIPAEMLLNEPGPSKSKKDDYEEDVKEPEMTIKKEEDPEVIKMIEEIEDEFAAESDEDYISMKSESPEPPKPQDISDDELTQAQIYEILKETNSVPSAGTSNRGVKQDKSLTSVENELAKMFAVDTKGKDEQRNELNFENKCEHDVLAVFEDVPAKNDSSKTKPNIQILNNAMEDKVGSKYSAPGSSNFASTRSEVNVKKVGISSSTDCSFNILKSPKKEKMSPKKEKSVVDMYDEDSSSNEFIDVAEQKLASGNLVLQFDKISRQTSFPTNGENGMSSHFSPKKELLSPKKEKMSPSKEQPLVEMSDSGSSSEEFLEVEEQNEMNSFYQKSKLDEFVQESMKKEKETPSFEIVIEPSKCQIDDLFADVFPGVIPSSSSCKKSIQNSSEDKNSSEANLEAKNSLGSKIFKSENIDAEESEVSKENSNSFAENKDCETSTNLITRRNNSPSNEKLNNEGDGESNEVNTVNSEVESQKVAVAATSADKGVGADNCPAKSLSKEDDPSRKAHDDAGTGSHEQKTDPELDMLSQLNALARKNYATPPQKDKSTPASSNPPGKNPSEKGVIPPQAEETVPISEYTEPTPIEDEGDAEWNESDAIAAQEGTSSQYFDPDTLKNLQAELEMERDQLLIERGRQERLASSITDQMNLDAQELLKIFGIPYIVAPMEAEAQCAFLDSAMLTEGTITDDSDIWLFGGRKVYKNFFDQKKHVLSFRIAEITHFFKLSRAQLIQLAFLVGSDYTPGLKGVGPVTALEILSFFKESNEEEESRRVILSGLEKFKEWLKKPENIRAQCVFANKIKNLTVHEGFPNPAVVDAYLQPEVDDSNEGFSWGTPDLKALEDFVWVKFGWTKSKLDHLMNPVMKRISERTNQTSIDRFFQTLPSTSHDREIKSKRVKRAIDQLSGEVDPDEPLPSTSKRKKKKIEGVTSNAVGDEQEAGASGASTVVEPPVAEGTPFDERIKTLQSKNLQTKTTRKRATKKSVESVAQPSTSSSQSSSLSLPKETVEFEEKNKSEVIPQREKDNIEKLKRKMKAVEIFAASKKNQRGKRKKPNMRRKGKIETSSYLSESSDSE